LFADGSQDFQSGHVFQAQVDQGDVDVLFGGQIDRSPA
jgi:hypothetical protein